MYYQSPLGYWKTGVELTIDQQFLTLSQFNPPALTMQTFLAIGMCSPDAPIIPIPSPPIPLPFPQQQHWNIKSYQ